MFSPSAQVTQTSASLIEISGIQSRTMVWALSFRLGSTNA
jgi:hypothetical protein